MFTYYTKGTCSRQIDIEIEDNKIVSCKFYQGCKGNLQGVSSLIVGMEVDEVIGRLKGIKCQGDTSCPDQLAKALEKYKAKQEKAARAAAEE